MISFKKIVLIFMATAFFCALPICGAQAKTYSITKNGGQYYLYEKTGSSFKLKGTYSSNQEALSAKSQFENPTKKEKKTDFNKYKLESSSGLTQSEQEQRLVNAKAALLPEGKQNNQSAPRSNTYVDKVSSTAKANLHAECRATCTKDGYSCKEETVGSTVTYRCTQDAGAGSNTAQKTSAVTGCSAEQGLFSGLIGLGRKTFYGLRDLIYVVAGFGIIGVAVGGFFGNLNWKWLGAIVISLVVIASTGEIINMITGCENFTSSMIQDTLK